MNKMLFHHKLEYNIIRKFDNDMKMSSYNIQNIFFKHKDKTLDIIKFINKYKIDILGLQEYLLKEANKFNLDSYRCVGKGRLFRKNSIFNETCSIITNKEVISNKSYKLPWFFTTFRRIMNVSKIKDNKNEYLVINTHLDHLNKMCQKKQLNYIYKFLSNIDNKNNIILMGDFNLDLNNKTFINFTSKLSSIGINRVEITDKTYKNLDKPIDHIFISSNIKLLDKKVIIDDSLDISDHYPLYVEIK